VRLGFRSLSLTPRKGGAGGAVTDNLKTQLDTLDAASKIISAWYLPRANPTQYLTLNGSIQVTQWTASHGTNKLNLTEATNPPPYDGTAFGGKGGVTFNGTSNRLSNNAGPFTGWPGSATPFYFVAGARNDIAGTVAGLTAAATIGNSSTYKMLGRLSASNVNRVHMRDQVTAINQGVIGAFSGAHAASAYFSTTANACDCWTDTTDEGAGGTSSSTFTLAEVVMGHKPTGFAGGPNFWNGAICCLVVANNTLTAGDLTNLQSAIISRLS
jgi:hypothetical protein